MGVKEETTVVEQEDGAFSPAKKKKVTRQIVFALFQAVLQHVMALQSEVRLFNDACGGDQALTSRCLASATALSGLVGLFLNQIGGKLSDSLGRKPFLLTGPLVTMGCGLAAFRNSKSIATLMMVRILKSVFITFSGTVMCSASFSDMLNVKERTLVNGQVFMAVGSAVVLGPYVESLILKITRGDAKKAFLAMCIAAFVQLVNNYFGIPETNIKKRPLGSILDIFKGMNPFNFLTVFRGKNQVLKKLITIQTFQYCSDGKVTSDLCQQWVKNQLSWTADTTRDFVAFWGACVTVGGGVIQQALLKMLPTRAYSTLGNLCVWAAMTMHGIMPKGIFMWAPVPLLIPGVNGGASHSITSLATEHGKREGYGNGEMTAWSINLRTLVQSLDILFLGMWYARCTQRKIYPGTTWFIAAFLGGGLPQLLIWSMKAKDFDPLPELKADSADVKGSEEKKAA